MMSKTVIALAVVGATGLSMVAAHAQQEREQGHEQQGHESAHGPSAGPMRGPSESVPAPGRANPAPRAAPGMPPGHIGGAPPRAATPDLAPAPGRGPQSQPFGQRPMGQAPSPAPAVQAPSGPAHSPGFNQGRRPGPAPRAPVANAPRAYGAVPSPYRGDMHHFVDLDARVWRGGRWHHDRHGGRFGWWWVVGGLWYFYPQPVYPYPDPFSPGDVDDGPGQAGQYWYYCESAGQYYPYVTDCPEGWEAVVPDQ